MTGTEISKLISLDTFLDIPFIVPTPKSILFTLKLPVKVFLEKVKGMLTSF